MIGGKGGKSGGAGGTGGKGGRGEGGSEGQEGGRKVPQFARRNHSVTHADARRMRERYIEKYAGRSGAIDPGAYGRKIFDMMLEHPECVGLRFYPGVDEEGNVTLLFCGVNAEGNDILVGTIGDIPWRCPPFCSGGNGVLQF